MMLPSGGAGTAAKSLTLRRFDASFEQCFARRWAGRFNCWSDGEGKRPREQRRSKSLRARQQRSFVVGVECQYARTRGETDVGMHFN